MLDAQDSVINGGVMHVSFPSEDDIFHPIMMGPPTLVAAMKPRLHKEMDDAIELYQDELNIF